MKIINQLNVDYNRVYHFSSTEFNLKEVFTPYLKNRGGIDDGIKKHIKKLMDGIVKDGGLDNFPPIFVDINTYQIVDGNCRFNAAMDALEYGLIETVTLPVLFWDVSEGAFDERVVSFNQDQKSWTLVDFIYNYSMRGYESFTKLIEFCKSEGRLHKNGMNGKINIVPRYAAAALGIPHDKLKDKTFTLTDEQIEFGRQAVREAEEILKLFSDNIKDYDNTKGYGGGWYEQYLKAWSESRSRLGNIPFAEYLKVMERLLKVKNGSNYITPPIRSPRKPAWTAFFAAVLAIGFPR